jgi:hypothetical protein
MINAPEKMPPTPMPEIALPTIKALLEGATPHNREPSSNIRIATKKVALTWIEKLEIERGEKNGSSYAKRLVDAAKGGLK